MKRSTQKILHLTLIGAALSSLGACNSVRSFAGMGPTSPDEFAVVTKAPLIIPPDYNLRPPAPGAAPTNEPPPAEAARAALFDNPTQASSAAKLTPGTYSRGEQSLLVAAHVERANPSIRKQLQSDEASMQGADDDFTNSVLFWQAPKTSDSPVNPATANAPAAPAQQPQPAPQKSSGWFDWF